VEDHFPRAHAGVLVIRDVSNPPFSGDLARDKEALEEQLRLRFAGRARSDLEALPILQAYEAYYKRFKKTYHVQLQLESIAFKGKSIPNVAALVEAMFMAEVKNLLLTAGHDLDALRLLSCWMFREGTKATSCSGDRRNNPRPGI